MAIVAHPPRPVKIGEKRAQAPTDGIGIGLNFQAVDLVPNEFVWPAVFRGDDWFLRGPAFQSRDAERFVAAGHANRIASLVKIDQLAAVAVTEEARGVGRAQLARARF